MFLREVQIHEVQLNFNLDIWCFIMDDEDSICQLLEEIVGNVRPQPGLFCVCVGRAHNTGYYEPVPMKKRLTGFIDDPIWNTNGRKNTNDVPCFQVSGNWTTGMPPVTMQLQ